jgi:hypothetical protein
MNLRIVKKDAHQSTVLVYIFIQVNEFASDLVRSLSYHPQWELIIDHFKLVALLDYCHDAAVLCV